MCRTQQPTLIAGTVAGNVATRTGVRRGFVTMRTKCMKR